MSKKSWIKNVAIFKVMAFWMGSIPIFGNSLLATPVNTSIVIDKALGNVQYEKGQAFSELTRDGGITLTLYRWSNASHSQGITLGIAIPGQNEKRYTLVRKGTQNSHQYEYQSSSGIFQPYKLTLNLELTEGRYRNFWKLNLKKVKNHTLAIQNKLLGELQWIGISQIQTSHLFVN